MRTLVTIEHKQAERNELAGLIEDWQEFAQCWCAVETQPGSETIEGGKQVAQRVLVLEMHWTPALAELNSRMRLRLPDGRLLGIRSVENERLENRLLRLTCAESV